MQLPVLKNNLDNSSHHSAANTDANSEWDFSVVAKVKFNSILYFSEKKHWQNGRKRNYLSLIAMADISAWN